VAGIGESKHGEAAKRVKAKAVWQHISGAQ